MALIFFHPSKEDPKSRVFFNAGASFFIESNMIDKIVEKKRQVLIQFRTMQDILLKEQSWFDGHGNLCALGLHQEIETLSPAYFSYLGKLREIPSHHGFPRWCIEKEWDDLFAANSALRVIASGTLNPDEAIILAEKAVLIKNIGTK